MSAHAIQMAGGKVHTTHMPSFSSFKTCVAQNMSAEMHVREGKVKVLQWEQAEWEGTGKLRHGERESTPVVRSFVLFCFCFSFLLLSFHWWGGGRVRVWWQREGRARRRMK